MNLLDDYLSDLNEAKRTSMHRTTRKTKIKRATGQLATTITFSSGILKEGDCLRIWRG